MISDLRGAVSFLTILPLGYDKARPPGKAFAYFPLVGLLIGALLLLVRAPLENNLSALLIVMVWVFITGGLHLDGLADSCDALFAPVSPERRLEIMKDPHIGTWGVVGVVLILLGKFVAVQYADLTLLLLAPASARVMIVIAAYALPYARQEGLGATMREGLGLTELMMALAYLWGSAVAFLLHRDVPALLALSAGVVCGLLLALWARRRLGGGLTGDVYGLLCEVTELVTLLASTWLIHLYA